MGNEFESNKRFGEFIKNARESNGKTLKEISQISGISQSHIYRLEVEERKVSSITLVVFIRLAQALGLSVHDLIKVAIDDMRNNR